MNSTLTDNQLFDSLNRPLEIYKTDKSLWNDKCNYTYPMYCDNFNPNGHNLIVLQHNMRNLLSHQSEVRHLLQMLANKNSGVDILILCETFLMCKTERLVNILGYSLVTNNRTNHKGGGVAILIKNGIVYEKKAWLEHDDRNGIGKCICWYNSQKW